jgi:hypothetical protein
MRADQSFSWSRVIAGAAFWLVGMFAYHWVTTGSAAMAVSDMGLHSWQGMLVCVAGALMVGGGVELARGWQRREPGR